MVNISFNIVIKHNVFLHLSLADDNDGKLDQEVWQTGTECVGMWKTDFGHVHQDQDIPMWKKGGGVELRHFMYSQFKTNWHITQIRY